MSRVVILYGPPGSGKGTQAELLSRKYDFIHFDSGRYIEALVHSEAAKKDPILMREKKNFDTGILCTPEWVLKVTRNEAIRVAKSGFNLVFSGAPRTLFEAFGDDDCIVQDPAKGGRKTKGLIESLEKAFGRENISVILFTVGDNISIFRNSNRKVCSVCGLPLLESAKTKHCGLCGGAMRTRTLDKVEIIKDRLVQYKTRTFPIIKELKKRGYAVKTIKAEKLPFEIFKSVERALKLR